MIAAISGLVGLAVHDVAPVAPDGANVEQDGLVFGLRARKGRFAPRVPLTG
jgi:sugar lactone lactonase YvrE